MQYHSNSSYNPYSPSRAMNHHHHRLHQPLSRQAQPAPTRPTSSYEYSSMVDAPRPPFNKRPRTSTVATRTSSSSSSRQQNASRRINGRDLGELKTDMAYKWWNDHLRITKNRKVGWIEFRPAAKLIENSGFIPVQYVHDLLQHDSSSGSVSSLSSASTKQVTLHVLKHGKRGIHYAIGWTELYDLVRRFGKTRKDDHYLRPGDPHHEIIVDYKGPPLFHSTESKNTGLPKQVLSPSRSLQPNNRIIEEKKPLQSRAVVAATRDPAPSRKRALETEEERLRREDEEFCLAQEARCNRMIMIGFWESRRISFPSLYEEKFPNGIENADF